MKPFAQRELPLAVREPALGPDEQHDRACGRARRRRRQRLLRTGGQQPACSRLRQAPRWQSPSAAGSRTSGTRLRPHCSQAEIAMACQCSSLRARCFASSFTTERSASTGTMRVTPSSVAFCTMRSMRSPRATPCSSVTCSGDSRSIGVMLAHAGRDLLAGRRPSVAAYSPPAPLNSVSACAGFEAQHAREMLAGLRRASTMSRAGGERARARRCGSGACELDAFAGDAREQFDLLGCDDVRRHEVDRGAERADRARRVRARAGRCAGRAVPARARECAWPDPS